MEATSQVSIPPMSFLALSPSLNLVSMNDRNVKAENADVLMIELCENLITSKMPASAMLLLFFCV